MYWLRKNLSVSRLQKLRNEITWSSLNQEETLRKRIQQRRLAWFGSVERMEDNRIPHRVLHCYIKGNRNKERKRKTWMDNVKEDLKTLNP